MSIYIIKVLVGLLLIALGVVFIKFGDKQFGKYGSVSRVLFDDRSGIPEKIRIWNRKFQKWSLGMFFIVVGIFVIFAIPFH